MASSSLSPTSINRKFVVGNLVLDYKLMTSLLITEFKLGLYFKLNENLNDVYLLICLFW